MSVLYAQDIAYKARTAAEAADVVSAVPLPTASVTANTVLRGKLAGKNVEVPPDLIGGSANRNIVEVAWEVVFEILPLSPGSLSFHSLDNFSL